MCFSYDHMWYMWELQNLTLKFCMASTLLWFSSISRINQLRQAVFMMTFTLVRGSPLSPTTHLL